MSSRFALRFEAARHYNTTTNGAFGQKSATIHGVGGLAFFQQTARRSGCRFTIVSRE